MLRIGAIALALLATLAVPAPALAAWSGWAEVPGGGLMYDAPNAVTFNGRMYLFVRGGGNGVYVNVKDGTTWSGWSAVPGGQVAQSAPAAVVYGGQLWLFALAPSHPEAPGHPVTRNAFNGSSWSGWQVITNSRWAGAPEAVVYDDRLWLFLSQYDGAIHSSFYNGATWSAIAEVPGGGVTYRAPTAAVYGNRLWLFVTGTDSRPFRNTYNGLAWSGWKALPGTAQTPNAPAAVVFGNRIWLLVRSSAGEIFRNRFNGSWSGWAEIPGNGLTPSAPGPVAQGKRLWVFVRALNDTIYFNRFTS